MGRRTIKEKPVRPKIINQTLTTSFSDVILPDNNYTYLQLYTRDKSDFQIRIKDETEELRFTGGEQFLVDLKGEYDFDVVYQVKGTANVVLEGEVHYFD